MPIEPQRLLEETAWVRRLARTLARDEPSADDLVQDALVAALRKPPPDARSEGALRAWLGAVTRNLAIHRARETSRRGRREREAAREELEHSQERLLELEELRSELVRHVLALPEELREVVLLSFFEELDAAEIARRFGIPDSTVRNRLRRALAELRVRIEHAHGRDWRNLCLFLVPASGAKVAAGGAAMAAGGLWLAGGSVALVALLAFAFWQRQKPHKLDETASLPVAPVAQASESPAPDPIPAASATPRSERMSATAPTGGARALVLFGRVFDGEHKPVKSASLGLTDERGQTFECGRISDGWYSFASLAPDVFDVNLRAEDCAPLHSTLDLRSSSGETRHDFELVSASFVQVRLLRSDGTLWPTDRYGHSREREYGLCVVATTSAPGKRLPPSDWGDYWNFGVGEYHSEARDGSANSAHRRAGSSGVLEVFAPRPVFASLCQNENVLETKPVDAGTDALDFVLSEEYMNSLVSSAVVTVIDESSGRPAEGVSVSLTPGWISGPASKSIANGEALFNEVALGRLDLELGAIRREVNLGPHQDHNLGTVQWLPTRGLRAHVVDSDGRPASADIRLALSDAGLAPCWCAERMSANSNGDGVFSWQDGPGFALSIIATHTAPPLEAGVGRLARGEGLTAEIAMRPARMLRVRCENGAGGPFLVLVFDDSGNRWAENDWGGGRLILPDGHYRFEVWKDERKVHESSATVDSDTRGIELKF